jgi:hypothetical protein
MFNIFASVIFLTDIFLRGKGSILTALEIISFQSVLTIQGSSCSKKASFSRS